MNAKSLIGGILAGAAVGVAIGMLLAPESGAKTQEKLVKGARKLGDDLMQTAEGSIQSVKDRFNSRVDDVAKRSKEGINSLSERVKA
jgi:gas vesicle protein